MVSASMALLLQRPRRARQSPRTPLPQTPSALGAEALQFACRAGVRLKPEYFASGLESKPSHFALCHGLRGRTSRRARSLSWGGAASRTETPPANGQDKPAIESGAEERGLARRPPWYKITATLCVTAVACRRSIALSGRTYQFERAAQAEHRAGAAEHRDHFVDSRAHRAARQRDAHRLRKLPEFHREASEHALEGGLDCRLVEVALKRLQLGGQRGQRLGHLGLEKFRRRLGLDHNLVAQVELREIDQFDQGLGALAQGRDHFLKPRLVAGNLRISGALDERSDLARKLRQRALLEVVEIQPQQLLGVENPR